MKCFLSVVIVTVLCVSGVAEARTCRHETVLSSCWVFAPFRPENIRRKGAGPGNFDTIYYVLPFKERRKILVVNLDFFGHPTSQKEVQQEIPGWKSFEISERDGNEFTLKGQIEDFLTTEAFHTCPSP